MAPFATGSEVLFSNSFDGLILGKDSCNGDSGGPLMARKFGGDPWVQIGLVSFGTVPCANGTTVVYTKIIQTIL